MLPFYWLSYRSLCYHPTDRPTDHYATILLIIMVPSYWSLHPTDRPTDRSTDHYATILLMIMHSSYWPSCWSLCYHSTDRPTDHYATILLTVLLIIMLPSYWSLCYHPTERSTDQDENIMISRMKAYWSVGWKHNHQGRSVGSKYNDQ